MNEKKAKRIRRELGQDWRERKYLVGRSGGVRLAWGCGRAAYRRVKAALKRRAGA